MKTFTDNAGRTWSVVVNVDAIKRVRALLDVDLLDVAAGDLLERLASDPVLLCDVLYAVCKVQADAEGVSDEEFGRAMAGDAIDGAKKKRLAAEYKGKLFRLTGKVNSKEFKGLDPGECLFLGASGSKRGDEDWEITFRFAALPNRTNLTVGDIKGINKKGWEYMWVRYADAEDAAAKAIVKKPVAVYVEQVYEYANFAELGIGT